MGSNISPDQLKTWLRNNYWKHNRTKKHEIWDLYIEDEETGVVLLQGVVTINMHRSKGSGIAERMLETIAKKMNMTKNQLVSLIREKKEYNYNDYSQR